MKNTTDASSLPEWQQFVNLYRVVHGSNNDLDAPYIRNMGSKELQNAISSMQALSTLTLQ